MHPVRVRNTTAAVVSWLFRVWIYASRIACYSKYFPGVKRAPWMGLALALYMELAYAWCPRAGCRIDRHASWHTYVALFASLNKSALGDWAPTRAPVGARSTQFDSILIWT